MATGLLWPLYSVVSLRISTGVTILWIGAAKGTGFLFFCSFICITRRSMASYAILSICCPIVLVGMMASLEIGESSKPIIR